MKLAFILLFVSLSSIAFEIKVSQMKQDGALERSFVLSTQLPEVVVIDCQSFIMGLRIGEAEEATTFMMGDDECDGLQNRIWKSLKKTKKHCIEVDSDIRSDYSC